MEERANVLLEKSKAFAIRIINLYKHLVAAEHEYVLSKQILRSGTSIGANCRESSDAQSTADFINKLSIALKEADETQYWLELLHDTDFLSDFQFQSIYSDASELVALLTTIIKTTKNKLRVEKDVQE